MHDRLEDRGEGRHPDPGPDEDGVLGVEDEVGRRPEGTVKEHLEAVVDLADVGGGGGPGVGLSPGLGPGPEQVVSAVLLRDPVQDEVVGGAEVRLTILLLLLGDHI